MRSTKGFFVFACAAGILGLLAFSMSGFAAKGGIPGPPTGGEVGNNLSLPSVSVNSVNSVIANWNIPAGGGSLGKHYSYGCDQEEFSGQFSYPNTSCVDSLDAPTIYYTAASCTSIGYPCDGLPVERIYWQKVDVNEWWADEDGISPEDGYVDYVDWGDALEAVSWTEKSVVRVETQPYTSTIPGFDPVIDFCQAAAIAASLDPEVVCKVGFQMWHVSGQGITEHWGVRASDANTAVSYNYDSPFQIINTSNAMLNISKLVPESATCPDPGAGEPGETPPTGPWVWNALLGEWDGTLVWRNDPYSVEVSVGGKYVFGYNWRMRDVDNLPAGWQKTGYWRLTFYAPNDVIFADSSAPNVAPPTVPSVIRALPRNGVFNTVLAPPPPPVPVTEEEDPTADDRLFKPVVDTANNLTFIDICIKVKEQGGGGGGNGGNGGPGVGGGIGGGRSDNHGNH